MIPIHIVRAESISIKQEPENTYESSLEVDNAEIDNDLKDKEIIVAHNINVDGSYKETLTIIFDVGNEYNGKTLNIRHNGTEEFEVIVSEGKVSVEVDHLSPFIIYTEKVVEPDIPDDITPDVPDDITPDIPNEPDIKPNEPTPDISIIGPNDSTFNKPVQTIPNGNKPQQSIVPTADNHNILLWSLIGIMSITTTMIIKKMSQKKRNH